MFLLQLLDFKLIQADALIMEDTLDEIVLNKPFSIFKLVDR